MDPDDVPGPIFRDHRVGEAAIDGLVEREVLNLQGKLANEIVEERPEDGVAEAFVIALHLVDAQRDGPYVVAAIRPFQALLVDVGQRLAVSRPPDPDAATAFVDAGQPGREAPGAGSHLERPVDSRHRDGESVGYDQHPP